MGVGLVSEGAGSALGDCAGSAGGTPSSSARAPIQRPRLLSHAPAAVHVEPADAGHPLLVHLPELDRLVVGGYDVLAAAAAAHPPDLVDLLLDLQGLQVIELRLVGLELGEVAVLKAGAARRGRRRALVHADVALRGVGGGVGEEWGVEREVSGALQRRAVVATGPLRLHAAACSCTSTAAVCWRLLRPRSPPSLVHVSRMTSSRTYRPHLAAAARQFGQSRIRQHAPAGWGPSQTAPRAPPCRRSPGTTHPNQTQPPR